MRVLGEYHEAAGPLIFRYEATLDHFAGDGLMVVFNDPVPCPDPAARAVRMAVEMQRDVGVLVGRWRKRGYDLGLGIGIAMGYATLGQMGFKEQFNYGAVGSVLNLASRLSDEAKAGQVLVTQRVFSAVEDLVAAEPAGELTLKGFLKPVTAFNVTGLNADAS